MPNSFKDRAYGCVLGAFIGDACGSFLEFNDHIADENDMNLCMGMPGKGYWGLAPGQVTDDSELAMSLLHGLVQGNRDYKGGEEPIMSTIQIAQFY